MYTLLITLLFFANCGLDTEFDAAKAEREVSKPNSGGYSVLFTRQKNREDNIYLISADGKTHQITVNPRKDSSAFLSKDGKHMVFTSERVGWWKIWSMDVEKKTFAQLTDAEQAEYGPYWSPDARRIVFRFGPRWEF